MLKDSTVRAVSPLADLLANSGVSLAPTAGTVLNELAQACYTPKLDNSNPLVLDGSRQIVMGMDAWTVGNELKEASRTKNAANVNEHDLVMDNTVQVVKKIVQGNLTLARNVVKPIIKSVVEETQRRIKDVNLSKVNMLNVVVDSMEPVWLSSAFQDMIEKYSEAPVNNPKIKRIFPVIDPGQLQVLLKTGSSRFDEDLQALLSSVGEDLAKDVYFAFFQKHASNEGFDLPSDALDYLDPRVSSRNNILLVHLLARKMANAVPEGVVGISLGDYREYMSIIVEQTGRLLCRLMERRDRNIRQKVLVTQYPVTNIAYVRPDEAIIYVNGDLYNQWLAAGGSPEVLFGAYVSGDYSIEGSDYDALLKNAEKHKAAWRRQFGILQSEQMARAYNTTIVALRNAVLKEIESIPDENLMVSRDVLKDRLLTMLENVQSSEIDDLYELARRVVCRVMFAHTQAEAILAEIDNIAYKNPSMDVKEVALLATIAIVSRWVAKLITVSTFKLD